MLNTSLSPWPSFTQEEADAVSKVLLSNKVNYWTGTECREFEKEFAAFVGTQYAVALSNGTLALDVALKAMGIGQGDDVIVTSRTFLASASCIVTAGANPVFADVDLNSQNISAETIKAALTPNTKAIIVVHLAGMPAEMDDIMAWPKNITCGLSKTAPKRTVRNTKANPSALSAMSVHGRSAKTKS